MLLRTHWATYFEAYLEIASFGGTGTEDPKYGELSWSHWSRLSQTIFMKMVWDSAGMVIHPVVMVRRHYGQSSGGYGSPPVSPAESGRSTAHN